MSEAFEKFRSGIFILLSFSALLCAALRASGNKDMTLEVLYFLLMAGALLFLERVKRISIGKDSFELEIAEKIEQIDSKVSAVQQQVEAVGEVAVVNSKVLAEGVGSKGRGSVLLGAQAAGSQQAPNDQETAPAADPDDPHKGRFGGKADANDRRLSAEVTPALASVGLYNAALEVRSTNALRPLKGDVVFYLHPTFRNPVRRIPVRDGAAQLDLLAYGGFTVGAEMDGGATRLELDLSLDPRFPEEFRLR